MDKNNNHYQENSFEISQSPNYILLIQFEVKSFTYAIVFNKKLMAYCENYPIYLLDEPGELADLLSATYQKVFIGLPGDALTLVPNPIFLNSKVADYARYLDVKYNEKVLAQKFDSENIIIYKTQVPLIKLVEKFGLDNTVYALQGWVKALANQPEAANKIYIEIGNDHIHFLYFLTGKLHFYQIFEVVDEDDLAYFSVLVAEQLQLNPRSTTLSMSGIIETSDNKFASLSRFFEKVELTNVSLVELPWHLENHKVLSTVSLLLCESSEEA
jgi:hypothetical protein